MKFTKKVSFIVLAIFLILHGLIVLAGLAFAGMGVIMGALAIAAGVLLLLDM